MLGTFRFQVLAGGQVKILDGWAHLNIVKVPIPQLAGIENAPKNCFVYFHRAGARQLQSLFAAWEHAELLYLIKTWAGSFVPRLIRGSATQLSNHAFGSAFDINAAWNGLGRQPATGEGTLLPLVKLANQHGFFWGGHYSNRKDGMHFELAVLNMFPASLPNLRASEIDLKIPVKSSAVGDTNAARLEPMPVTNGSGESKEDAATGGASSTETKIKTESVEINSKTPTGIASQPSKNFEAVIPQIDTAKSYLQRLFSGSVLATVGAMMLGLPQWLQISLAVLVLVTVVGGIVLFARYHKEIFGYVTAMNTLRATQGVDNPILKTEQK